VAKGQLQLLAFHPVHPIFIPNADRTAALVCVRVHLPRLRITPQQQELC
jgi:hypothetical protein